MNREKLIAQLEARVSDKLSKFFERPEKSPPPEPEAMALTIAFELDGPAKDLVMAQMRSPSSEELERFRKDLQLSMQPYVKAYSNFQTKAKEEREASLAGWNELPLGDW